jgi:hypothetical protein
LSKGVAAYIVLLFPVVSYRGFITARLVTSGLLAVPDRAVSCRLPTARARVRYRVKSCAVCGHIGAGAGFLRVLRFPLPILIPPTVPRSQSSIIRGWYNRPNSGRRTKVDSVSQPYQEIKKKVRNGLKQWKFLFEMILEQGKRCLPSSTHIFSPDLQRRSETS